MLVKKLRTISLSIFCDYLIKTCLTGLLKVIDYLKAKDWVIV